MYTVHRFWEQTGADQVHHFFPPVAEKSAEEHGEVCHLPHVYLCFSICLEFRVIFFFRVSLGILFFPIPVPLYLQQLEAITLV